MQQDSVVQHCRGEARVQGNLCEGMLPVDDVLQPNHTFYQDKFDANVSCVHKNAQLKRGCANCAFIFTIFMYRQHLQYSRSYVCIVLKKKTFLKLVEVR